MENNYGEKLIILPDLQIMKLPWKNQTKVEAGAMINIVLSKNFTVSQPSHRLEKTCGHTDIVDVSNL